MKKKNLILILSLLIVSIPHVKAETCDKADIERLTTIANHVDLSYKIEDIEIESEIEKRYRLVLANMTEDLYIIVKDNYNELQYNYKTTENKLFEDILLWSSGEFKIEIHSKNCNKKLRTIELQLPYYNGFHSDEFCNNVEEKLEICQEWTKESIDVKKFEEEKTSYNERHKNPTDDKDNHLSKIINKYTILITSAILLILIIVITIIIKRKRSELK